MLHFRSTVVAQMFQSQLKRPLTHRIGVKAVPAASAGFSTGAADGRSPGRGRAFADWRVPAHFTRRQDGRQFCTKGDGQNDAAKDSDKWVIMIISCVKRVSTDLFINGQRSNVQITSDVALYGNHSFYLNFQLNNHYLPFLCMPILWLDPNYALWIKRHTVWCVHIALI